MSAHAGIEMHAKLGDRIEVGQRLATLFSEDAKLLDEPEEMLRETLQISPKPPAPIPLVREIITKEQLRDEAPGLRRGRQREAMDARQ